MARNYGTVYITLKVHISLWDALKLRIAGSKIRQIKEKAQEDNMAEEDENKVKEKEEVEGIKIIFKNAFEQDKEEEEAEEDIEKAEDNVVNVRINEKTGKVEMCSAVYLSKVGFTETWVDYDKNLLWILLVSVHGVPLSIHCLTLEE